VTQKIVTTALRIAQGSKEKLVIGDLGIRRDWGWAPEYVVAMWKMLQKSKPEDFVICTGQSHSLEDFTARVFREVGLNWKHHVRHDTRLLRPTDLEVSRGCPRRAEEGLGWKSKTSFPQLIKKLVLQELS
jgi:GDPmannose 4,6-dehydratase